MQNYSDSTKKKIIISLLVLSSPITIPFALVTFLCYLVFIRPVQYIDTRIIKKQHQKQRLNKLRNSPEKIIDNKKIILGQIQQVSDMMFAFKPIPDMDIYVALISGNMVWLNNELRVINYKPLQYSFCVGQDELFIYSVSHKFYKRYVSPMSYYVPIGYLNTICRFQGQIYLVVLDFIFIITQTGLELVCQIPDYGILHKNSSCLYTQTQIFSFNHKLYVYNNSTTLFELRNKSLKRVSKVYNAIYLQFCEKLFLLNVDKLYKINSDFSLQFFVQIEFSRVLFSSSAVIVLATCDHELNEHIVYVLNLLDEKILTFPRSNEFNKINAELNWSGYCIRSQFVEQLGVDFWERAEERERAYYGNQLKYTKFVFECKLECLNQNRQEKIANQFEIIKQTMQTQMEKINCGIEFLLNKQKQTISRFQQLIDEGEQ
ncbi:Hypothetical_protein [Hexamita inflata]|uniref:Hypothetical_protein n=1 Tax=Hexamita inflata TaxID=28002 RepID=A0AA86UNR7_9EUKA|nr:Hypothetical protein HINF_LOCUS46412 [Hexamita inflata]